MGLMNSALQIGRSAILSYQSALQTIGSNISSVGSPDYTRLTPELDPLQGTLLPGGMQPGAGVALTGIQRNIDEALEARLRVAIGDEQSLLAQREALAQVEVLFDDISDNAVATQLADFFHSFDELQNTPENLAIRDLTIANGNSLAGSLQALRGRLAGLGEDLDRNVADLVTRADGLAQDLARLNEEISTAEAGVDGQATGLRDQRDALLRELSEIFDVTAREQANGALNVYIGSEALIQGNLSRGLIATENLDGTFTRTGIHFADTGAEVDARGGRLEGLVISRENHAYGRIQAIDELAAAIIAEVNRIHADGQGLEGFAHVTGSYAVMATDQPLSAAETGLRPPPQNGSFFITVADRATGTPVTHRIEVNPEGSDPPTTLDSLVAEINAQVEGVTASITSDNRLSLTAEADYSFTFGHDGQQARQDTSGVLAALGINAFFTGRDARDMAVNETLISRPELLAASSVFLSGDGATAGRVAALSTSSSLRPDGTSIIESYNALANSVAVTAAGVNQATEAAGSVLASLKAQKESISGVNLDEEAIALLKYERAFQGASRFVSTVDELLNELMAILR